ncbi:MAG TPA: (2Fe-2S)-binding protein [Devosiaceae bacterium]|nr:(2Fe-2S)-binding protein [Devosiaceae bacterium]
MLVCHCNIITDRDIEKVITGFLEEDPWQLIVPAKVYHELGKRGVCCGCFPNVVDIIIRVTENYHLKQGVDEEAFRNMRGRLDIMRLRHRRIIGEGRTTRYRKTQRSPVSGTGRS